MSIALFPNSGHTELSENVFCPAIDVVDLGSGGEKQRAALARAIATEPKILLLDEPFSSLDAGTAAHLRAELKNHQRHFKVTTIFVAHYWGEARELADRLGFIRVKKFQIYSASFFNF